MRTRGTTWQSQRQLEDLIDQGEAALLVVGEGKLEEALDKAQLKADKHVAKELDVLWKDVDKAVEEAAEDVS
jgi:ribonucleotide monophosphatase NagD (HAD superfamily)